MITKISYASHVCSIDAITSAINKVRRMMQIPGTTKKVIQSLRSDYALSIKKIAGMMGTTSKTLYEVLKGNRVSGDTELSAIQLYIRVKVANIASKAAREQGLVLSKVTNYRLQNNTAAKDIEFKSASHFFYIESNLKH